MHNRLTSAVAGGLALCAASAANAAACEPGKSGRKLTGDEAQAVYDCLAQELHDGYRAGDKQWIPAEFVEDYRNWTQASRFPAAPGFHGGRFLVTWVNETGAEQYLQYAEDGVRMPAGTVIAKESFAVNDAGEVVMGPLFLMQKVEAGVSPETSDWYYMAVTPEGAPMSFDPVAACSECHQGNFGDRDGLGYPVEEARSGG